MVKEQLQKHGEMELCIQAEAGVLFGIVTICLRALEEVEAGARAGMWMLEEYTQRNLEPQILEEEAADHLPAGPASYSSAYIKTR